MNKDTMIKIIRIAGISLFIFLILVTVVYAVAYAPATIEQEETTIPTTISTEPLLIDEPVLYEDAGYKEPLTYSEATERRDELLNIINELRGTCASGLYSDDATAAMQDEVVRLELDADLFQVDIDRFLKWEEEYPYATEVWYFLRTNGYSKEVSAAIIGNMIVETSGMSLALKPTIYCKSKCHYGLCQWSMRYYPKARGMTIHEQLDFLMSTIENEFIKYGFVYKNNFTYEDFLAMESPENAALAFAKVYERCGSGSYGARKRAARIAYEYFTSEVD